MVLINPKTIMVALVSYLAFAEAATITKKTTITKTKTVTKISTKVSTKVSTKISTKISTKVSTKISTKPASTKFVTVTKTSTAPTKTATSLTTFTTSISGSLTTVTTTVPTTTTTTSKETDTTTATAITTVTTSISGELTTITFTAPTQTVTTTISGSLTTITQTLTQTTLGASYSSVVACLSSASPTPILESDFTTNPSVAWLYKSPSQQITDGDGTTVFKPAGHSKPISPATVDAFYGGYLFTGSVADGDSGSINQTIKGLCPDAPYKFDSYHLTYFDKTTYIYAGGCSLIYYLDTEVVASVSLEVDLQAASTASWVELSASVTPTATTATLIASVTCATAPQGKVLFGIDDVVVAADPYGIKK